MSMIFAGMSGYSYKSWRGTFYPQSLRQADWLAHYASQLRAVEINNTFYRLPKRQVVESWAEQVPPGFRFTIKASRRITHQARLRDVGDTLQYLFSTLGGLGESLGAVLFQLPPNLPQDLGLLREFLAQVPAKTKVAMEFRNRSWFTDEVFAALSERDVALCWADHEDERLVAPPVATASWGYLRLRRGDYDDRSLRPWIRRSEDNGWDETYIFFKHEEDAASEAPTLTAARVRALSSHHDAMIAPQ